MRSRFVSLAGEVVTSYEALLDRDRVVWRIQKGIVLDGYGLTWKLIQMLLSVGDLLPVKVQFSTVAPLAVVLSIAQKLVVPVNVQSLIVTLLAWISTVASPKLMPLSTAPA